MLRSRASRNLVVGASLVAATFSMHQSLVLAQDAPPPKIAELPLVVIPADNAPEPIVVDGLKFNSWAEYLASDYYQRVGWLRKCGFTPGPFANNPIDDGGIAGGSVADCSSVNTNPGGAPIYAPTAVKFRIPVLAHIITNGATGNLSDSQVQANIIRMNADYKVFGTTPIGGPPTGPNSQIEFFLSDDFPTALAGGTTTAPGIYRYNNATWYADGGAYYNSIGRDGNNYFNFYTNSAGGGGVLGYTTSTPPIGGATTIGSLADRVVILYQTIGDPCGFGGPYCNGRTLTHEVGHYFGLFHPWDFSCDTGSCSTTGDRVCDTNQTNGPAFSCSAHTSCTDGSDDVRLYMDYHDDVCMDHFTTQQVNRMRCVIDNWRVSLPIRINLFTGNFTATPNTLTVATNVNGTTLCDNETQLGRSDGAGDSTGAYTGSPGLAEAGDEVAYKIVHPGGDLKLSLTGLASDLDLFLLGAAGTPASAIGRSTLAGSSSELVMAGALAPGTYYAIVDTFAISSHSVYGSPFTIRYSRCIADIDNNNTVDVNDLLWVISTWGPCPTACSPRCTADLAPPATGDCTIDVNDLLAVISTWGACP